MCVFICKHVQVLELGIRFFLERDLWAVLRCLMWKLGAKFQASSRAPRTQPLSYLSSLRSGPLPLPECLGMFFSFQEQERTWDNVPPPNPLSSPTPAFCYYAKCPTKVA